MRHGKDYMADKPGITSLAQLAEVRRCRPRPGRIYSICYSEHFQVRSTVRAGELVRAGAIGRMVNTVGLGPHRLTNAPRPPGSSNARSTAAC
jgi:predicted dehydrogenase